MEALWQIGEIFYVEIDTEDGEEVTWAMAGKEGEAVLYWGEASGTAS